MADIIAMAVFLSLGWWIGSTGSKIETYPSIEECQEELPRSEKCILVAVAKSVTDEQGETYE